MSFLSEVRFNSNHSLGIVLADDLAWDYCFQG